jgi:hypothetical protein
MSQSLADEPLAAILLLGLLFPPPSSEPAPVQRPKKRTASPSHGSQAVRHSEFTAHWSDRP